jgi:small subunit ribosomal protein S2
MEELKEHSQMEIDLKELLEAGCHFGHQTVRWNPKMKPYIYAARDGVHIFDLAKTKEGLENAVVFMNDVISKGGKILFIGTKRQAREVVRETAQKIGMPYVTQRWLGGMITNWDQIKKSIDKEAEMKRKTEANEYKGFTKKEQLLIARDIIKLEKFLGGINTLEKLPEAIFVVDPKRENAAVREARRCHIPVVAMIDTNGDPEDVDYVIPVNDDAAASINLIMAKVGEGLSKPEKKAVVKTEKKAAKK